MDTARRVRKKNISNPRLVGTRHAVSEKNISKTAPRRDTARRVRKNISKQHLVRTRHAVSEKNISKQHPVGTRHAVSEKASANNTS